MCRVIHLWDDTSVWRWAVQSQAFSCDGDTDRRQSHGFTESRRRYLRVTRGLSFTRQHRVPATYFPWTAELPGFQKIARQQMRKGETFIYGRALLWKKSGTKLDGWVRRKQKVQPATLVLVSVGHLHLPFSYIHLVCFIFWDFSAPPYFVFIQLWSFDGQPSPIVFCWFRARVEIKS